MPKNDNRTAINIYDSLAPHVNDSADKLRRIIELDNEEQRLHQEIDNLGDPDDYDRHEAHEIRNEIRTIRQRLDRIQQEKAQIGNISADSAKKQLSTIEKFNNARAALKQRATDPNYATRIQNLIAERNELERAIAELDTRIENRNIDLDTRGYSPDLHAESKHELDTITPKYNELQSRLSEVEIELHQLQNNR
ncbi:MAG: hypothetical protein IKB10_02490 [Alphaproteobacteria bacterium]|nr:hypothetical protein [Alphaproteobacteria bacterium]